MKDRIILGLLLILAFQTFNSARMFIKEWEIAQEYLDELPSSFLVDEGYDNFRSEYWDKKKWENLEN